MLVNRVRKNARPLRRWARREGVTCYRLYDRDIPEIPLVLDWYDGRLHAAEFRRRAPDPERTGAAWMATLVGAVAEALEVDPGEVYLKARERQKGVRQYQAQGRRERRVVVEEGDHRFLVNLRDYLDTGLFLDHRPLRARVEAEAAGARFLNLFCYTGAFTVYAAAGGAVASTSVDLSPTYVEWARDNLALNDLASPEHELWQADTFAALEELQPAGRRFDLAVVDPPTFSNSKRTDTVFDVQRDHGRLLAATLAVMRPGGVVYFSTNHRRFTLEATPGAAVCEDITGSTIPPDFRDRRIHRCWRLVAG